METSQHDLASPQHDRKTFDAKSKKRISYILPTKDKAQYLRVILSRFHNAIRPEDELIVVDGLSTDKSLDTVDEFDSIIDVYVSEPDISPGHAFNKGFLLASGRYIKLINDDDVFYLEAMDQAAEVMDRHSEVDVLVCGGTRQRGDAVRTLWLPSGTNYGKKAEDIFRHPSSGTGYFIRRSSLSRIGIFNADSVAVDAEFLCRAISKGGLVKFCRINMFHKIMYDHSAVFKLRSEWTSDYYRICRQYCSHRFYISFRWMLFKREHPFLQVINGVLTLPLRIVRVLRKNGVRGLFERVGRRISFLIQGKKKGPSDQDQSVRGQHHFIWDGGFS